MGEVMANVEAPRRFNTDLITAFAVGALLLAITGIYAVVAFSVSQRTQEIAIRMAVGAQRVGIARLGPGLGSEAGTDWMRAGGGWIVGRIADGERFFVRRECGGPADLCGVRSSHAIGDTVGVSTTGCSCGVVKSNSCVAGELGIYDSVLFLPTWCRQTAKQQIRDQFAWIDA